MDRNIIEIGSNLAGDGEVQQYSTYFSAFRINSNLTLISAPFQNRVLIVNQKAEIVKTITSKRHNWFPRWVIPYKDKYLYVDRNSNIVGFIQGTQIEEKYIENMEALLCASISYNGNIIIAGRGPNPVLELDENLNIVGRYLDSRFCIQSAQKISQTQFLICDNIRHQVYICTKEGHIIWEHGKAYAPGDYEEELSTPKYSYLLDDKVYIADGMNGRVKIVDYKTNSVVRIIEGDLNRNFWQPTCVEVLDNGNLLICDSFNQRIIELTNNGQVVWEFGLKKNPVTFELNNPRIIETENDEILVANSYNNNIVHLKKDNSLVSIYGGRREELFWPKSVKRTVRNTLLIVDSRNGRVIELDSKRNVVNILSELFFNNGVITLIDPHDIDELPDETLLITDAVRNVVINVDWKGNVMWVYGLDNELNDPHQCRVARDGNLIISDTGNHRVIKVNYFKSILFSIQETNVGKLFRPRWCQELDGGKLLITDSGNNRILITDVDGEVTYKYGGRWGNSAFDLREPRCAVYHKEHIYISDTINNRLLILNGDRINGKDSFSFTKLF